MRGTRWAKRLGREGFVREAEREGKVRATLGVASITGKGRRLAPGDRNETRWDRTGRAGVDACDVRRFKGGDQLPGSSCLAAFNLRDFGGTTLVVSRFFWIRWCKRVQ